MKVSNKLAKTLFKYSLVDNRVDEKKVSTVMEVVGKLTREQQLSLLKTYRKMLTRNINQNTALVETSVLLTENSRNDLEKVINDQFKKELTFEYTLNTNILGGLKVTVGDDLIDASLISNFEKLKQVIT